MGVNKQTDGIQCSLLLSGKQIGNLRDYVTSGWIHPPMVSCTYGSLEDVLGRGTEVRVYKLTMPAYYAACQK